MRGGWFRRSAWAAGLFVIALGLALFITSRSGDTALYPAGAGETIDVIVVSNGFHSGLIIPTAALRSAARTSPSGAALAVADRFGAYPWIEAGWGDKLFYQAVPTRERFDWQLGVRALFAPRNASVMHVVGLDGDPTVSYGSVDLMRLRLSVEGFGRLVRGLDASFARDPTGHPQEIGPGLAGPSLFYEGVGWFSIANVCNHWTARMLDLAGVPTSPLLATLPAGLVWDLRWRTPAERVGGHVP